jgi:triacylglycerol lipase
MRSDAPPLVLVHGLWDTPQLFRRLVESLDGRRDPLLMPHLAHRLGATPILELAETLGLAIEGAFGAEQPVDLLGFSMGGVIARSWIQLRGGASRTRRFISVGSPQQGTLTAQICPPWLMAGIADLKVGSPLMRRLGEDPSALAGIDCRSYYCFTDHMVVPWRSAVLPVGKTYPLPIWNHRNLVRGESAVMILTRALLEP